MLDPEVSNWEYFETRTCVFMYDSVITFFKTFPVWIINVKFKKTMTKDNQNAPWNKSHNLVVHFTQSCSLFGPVSMSCLSWKFWCLAPWIILHPNTKKEKKKRTHSFKYLTTLNKHNAHGTTILGPNVQRPLHGMIQLSQSMVKRFWDFYQILALTSNRYNLLLWWDAWDVYNSFQVCQVHVTYHYQVCIKEHPLPTCHCKI